MTKGITGSRKPDMMQVTARRPNLRNNGSHDILKSVPDDMLHSLKGTHLEREVQEGSWGDEEESQPTTQRVFITPDMVHNELKWRNLI